MATHPQLPASLGGVASSPPSVSAELEAIFLDATGLPSGRAARLPASRTVRSFVPGAARRSRIPVATFGVLAAAALTGLSAGAVMLNRPTTPPARQAVAQAAVPVPAAAPAPIAPVVTLAGAEESTTNLAQPKLQHASAPAASTAARGGGAHFRRAGRVTHGDLMSADRRLRRAYARAVYAGVPRHVLADYRDRWDDLRHDASWRPERVADGYAAMAGDLTRMSQRHRHHAPPPRRGWSEWRSLW